MSDNNEAHTHTMNLRERIADLERQLGESEKFVNRLPYHPTDRVQGVLDQLAEANTLLEMFYCDACGNHQHEAGNPTPNPECSPTALDKLAEARADKEQLKDEIQALHDTELGVTHLEAYRRKGAKDALAKALKIIGDTDSRLEACERIRKLGEGEESDAKD